MTPYNLYQGFKEKPIIDDGHKLIISDTGYGWGKGGKEAQIQH